MRKKVNTPNKDNVFINNCETPLITGVKYQAIPTRKIYEDVKQVKYSVRATNDPFTPLDILNADRKGRRIECCLGKRYFETDNLPFTYQ